MLPFLHFNYVRSVTRNRKMVFPNATRSISNQAHFLD